MAQLKEIRQRIRELFAPIDQGLEEYHTAPGAMLIDVRDPDEYASGHIPGAINIPLSKIRGLSGKKEKPLFLYCLKGQRSRRAAGILRKAGYNARSIGGINRYTGEKE